MEEDVGQNISVDVVGAAHGEGSQRSHADVNGLVLALVDDVLAGRGEDLLSLCDAGVAVGVRLDLALPGVRLSAGQAGDELGRGVGDHLDLEGQRQHVGVDAGVEEAGTVGSSLALLENAGEGLEGVLGQRHGGVVERVAHGGRLEFVVDDDGSALEERLFVWRCV